MPTLLLTGAASDMAVAIARSFAAAGYNIQLAARDTAAIAPLASDLHIRYEVETSVHIFDATAFDTHAVFYSGLPAPPDVSICVFGYMGEQETASRDFSEAARIIHTNYTGAVSLLNIIANDYTERGRGVIAGVSSVAGLRGRQSNYIYGSAKAGFTAYLSGLRNRLFHTGVHVVTVLPGFVYTRMTAGIALPPLLTARPEEVGNAVLQAVQKKKNVIYVKWFWRYIMLIIRLIPEPLFKKLKL